MISGAKAFDLANDALKGNRLKTTGITLFGGILLFATIFFINFASLLFSAPKKNPLGTTPSALSFR